MCMIAMVAYIMSEKCKWMDARMDSRVQVRLAIVCVGVCGFCVHSVSRLCVCVCVFSQWVNNKS